MAIIVEDGTIVAGADSYVTLAAYQAYGAARGWTLADSDPADEISLRRAFDGINRNWTYRGVADSADQPGAWPRSIAEGIPQRVKDAQCELAYQVQGGLDVFATITTSKTMERKKVGPIETEVETLPTGKPRVEAVTTLLRPYLSAGAGQVQLVRG